MISIDREFQFDGVLTIKRSQMLFSNSQPEDDRLNWFFLKIGGKQFSFIYKIVEPLTASYSIPFTAKLSFMLVDEVKTLIQLNKLYELLRGAEKIGTVKIISILD